VSKARLQRGTSLGQHLLDSMQELRAHLRGEIQLSETVYHIPPETDVRALREKLGLSQTDFAALFGFSVRSLQDWEQGRRQPEIPIRAYLAVIQSDPEAVIRALRAA
jgi:putative transcriptional regulator